MLIESNLIHDKITKFMNEAEESELNFSAYKVIISCLKDLRKFLNDIEVLQSEKDIKNKYACALEGLKDR